MGSSKSEKAKSKESPTSSSSKFFQGIGLIYGRVVLNESQKLTVEIEGKSFSLTYVGRIKKRFTKFLENNPHPWLYLRVYPKFYLHSQQLGFDAVSFHTEQPQQTQVNQFLLAGVWQLIPQLPEQPVISIYRNQLRSWESPYNLKINHIPVSGFDEPPYLYQLNNPTATKLRQFYELVVSFDPQQSQFHFLLLLDSTKKIPRYVRKKFKPKKPSTEEVVALVTAMKFPRLQKTASFLRSEGFLSGQIAVKGVTKETLTAMIIETLSNHPEAVRQLKIQN